jgi:DNA-directed RNA polymerase subunit RPC12/RpoP
MGYSPNQRWALSLAGVLHKMNSGHVDELGGWGENEHTRPWCRNTLRDFYGVDSPQSYAETARFLSEEGHTAQARAMFAGMATANPYDPKVMVVRDHGAHILHHGLLAWDLGRLVAVAGWAAWAGYVEEIEAWKTIMLSAKRVQETYDSWASFGQAYEIGRLFWSGGKPHDGTAQALRWLLQDPSSPWVTLPWTTDLGIRVVDPNAKQRFKRTVCPTCGASKSRPSITAYVYCDFCGSLADFDFQKACDTPAEKPGPAYENLNAQLKPMLDFAVSRGDVATYRQLQHRLYDAYVTACPQAVPFRTREPMYRRAYVSYMAEGAVASGFDPLARQHVAAVAQTVSGLAFHQPKAGVIRVAPHGFERMFNAVFAQQTYLDQIYQRGVYAMHPDKADRSIQQRIGFSLFVQGWLPMLEEAQAKMLLARTNLESEYVDVDPPKGDASSCAGCGAPLVVFPGAKRVVCEKCGQKIDVEGRLSCQGCGAPVAMPEGMGSVPCPHCKVMMRRVS